MRRYRTAARVSVMVAVVLLPAVIATPALGAGVLPERSRRAAAPTTTTITAPHGKKKRHVKKHNIAPTTSGASTKASLDRYCASVASGGSADVTLFDDAMRPLLTRGVSASALHTSDPSLTADATALLNTVTASVSPNALAQVPAAIRTDVQAVRTEKQAILQNLVNAANGDPSGVQFLVQASSTIGGVQQQLVDIAAFLQANCPAADRPPTTPSS